MTCRLLGISGFLILAFVGGFGSGCSGDLAGVKDDSTGRAPVVGTAEKPIEGEHSKAVEEIAEDWPDGTPRVRKHILHMPDGTSVEHGTFIRWHPNGNREYQGEYERGKKVGRHVHYHMNGRMWIESYYEDGERQGFSRQWDEQGNLRKEESYEKGVPHGTWTTWNAKGKIKWKGRFEHGKPVELPPEDRPE